MVFIITLHLWSEQKASHIKLSSENHEHLKHRKHGTCEQVTAHRDGNTDLQASSGVRTALDVQKSGNIRSSRERIYGQCYSSRTSKRLGRNSWEDDVL